MLTLKSVVIYSSLVAAGLNGLQLVDTYQQSHDALAIGASTQATPGPAATASTQTTAAAMPNNGNVAIAATATLKQAGFKPDYAALYLAVQARTGTPWQLLAAVHKVESGQNDSTARSSYAGAIGPMQFMPATFRAYAMDGNGDGRTDITNLDDAMLSAGRYLAAGGAARGQYSTALYRYNHSWSYVSQVEGLARKLGLKT